MLCQLHRKFTLLHPTNADLKQPHIACAFHWDIQVTLRDVKCSALRAQRGYRTNNDGQQAAHGLKSQSSPGKVQRITGCIGGTLAKHPQQVHERKRQRCQRQVRLHHEVFLRPVFLFQDSTRQLGSSNRLPKVCAREDGSVPALFQSGYSQGSAAHAIRYSGPVGVRVFNNGASLQQ